MIDLCLLHSDQLKPLIRDDTVTVHFVDALYKRFLDLKTAQLQKTLAAATAAKRSAEVSWSYSVSVRAVPYRLVVKSPPHLHG